MSSRKRRSSRSASALVRRLRPLSQPAASWASAHTRVIERARVADRISLTDMRAVARTLRYTPPATRTEIIDRLTVRQQVQVGLWVT